MTDAESIVAVQGASRSALRTALKVLCCVAATPIILLLGFRVHWHRCTICSVQEWERCLYGVPIEALSEREYDEFGTYAAWKKEHPGRTCAHKFVDAAAYTPPAVR